MPRRSAWSTRRPAGVYARSTNASGTTRMPAASARRDNSVPGRHRTARLPPYARIPAMTAPAWTGSSSAVLYSAPWGLDISDGCPGTTGDPVQCGHLVQDRVRELGRRVVHVPATESREIAIAHMCSDRHPARRGRHTALTHDARIAGMKSTGHVRARDQLEERSVVGDGPRAKTLAQIGVNVHEPSNPRIVERYNNTITMSKDGTVCPRWSSGLGG